MTTPATTTTMRSELHQAWTAYSQAYGGDGWCSRRMQNFMYQRRYRRTPPSYAWTEMEALERHHPHGGKVPTLWRVQGGVLIVAQIINDDSSSLSEVDWLGEVSNEESLCDPTFFREPWCVVKKCATDGPLLVVGAQRLCPRCGQPWARYPEQRAIQGPGRRTYWESGGYDRGEGATLSCEYQWAKVMNYDYEVSRREYWLQGMSRRDADLAARRKFKNLKKLFEGYLKGDWWFVGVCTYFYAISDIEDFDPEHLDLEALHDLDPLAEDSLWGIESDYQKSYIVECVEDHVHQHLDGVRKTLADRRFFAQPGLPGVV